MAYTKKQQSRHNITSVYFNESSYITVICINLNNLLINYLKEITKIDRLQIIFQFSYKE